ncbi:hypothetical protein BJ165DRAFT_1469465 [Panaeolus papilionaceus]|nr:hypothetical protein BJ165DRAFT_1469465 [Panaeolus papilionaceus]
MLLFPLVAALNPYTQYAIWGSATLAIGGIAGAFISESKALEAEEERSNKITELDELSGDEESFKQIQGKIELTLKNCGELCNLISAIGSIWAVLRTECQTICDSMKKAEDTNSSFTFNRMVGDDVLLGPYKKLEEILTLYANKVTSLSDCRKS